MVLHSLVLPRALLALLAVTLAACAGQSPPPPVPPMGVVAPPVSDTAVVTAAPMHTGRSDAATAVSGTGDDRRTKAAPLQGTAPTYVIGRIKGRSTDQLGRMLEPTQERVAQCVPGTSGMIRVRVESSNKTAETLLTIEPDVALDVQARRCILEALSVMQLDEDPSKRLGPGGFTSHIMISW